MNQKFQKFMKNRYGIVDNLYRFLLVLYVLLIIINAFIKSKIISILEILLIIYIFIRVFSKNVKKRQKENNDYLKIKRKIINIFKRKNIKDKEYIYKRCHHCHKLLKLPIPISKGIKTVNCPKCKRKNKFIILKKEKIEIIKK